MSQLLVIGQRLNGDGGGDFKARFWVRRKPGCRRICAARDWSKTSHLLPPISVGIMISSPHVRLTTVVTLEETGGRYRNLQGL